MTDLETLQAEAVSRGFADLQRTGDTAIIAEILDQMGGSRSDLASRIKGIVDQNADLKNAAPKPSTLDLAGEVLATAIAELTNFPLHPANIYALETLTERFNEAVSLYAKVTNHTESLQRLDAKIRAKATSDTDLPF